MDTSRGDIVLFGKRLGSILCNEQTAAWDLGRENKTYKIIRKIEFIRFIVILNLRRLLMIKF
jgi:hypothetical protein